MTEARHDDLDLADPEDRALYRQRVAVEFAYMKLGALRAEAGVGQQSRRFDAIRAIADRRLQAMGHAT